MVLLIRKGDRHCHGIDLEDESEGVMNNDTPETCKNIFLN